MIRFCGFHDLGFRQQAAGISVAHLQVHGRSNACDWEHGTHTKEFMTAGTGTVTVYERLFSLVLVLVAIVIETRPAVIT